MSKYLQYVRLDYIILYHVGTINCAHTKDIMFLLEYLVADQLVRIVGHTYKKLNVKYVLCRAQTA